MIEQFKINKERIEKQERERKAKGEYYKLIRKLYGEQYEVSFHMNCITIYQKSNPSRFVNIDDCIRLNCTSVEDLDELIKEELIYLER